jgi:surface polysaccharide O-acyltransferase-like enzyme
MKKFQANTPSSPRLFWPDVVRIIAIYLVIHLHTFPLSENLGLPVTLFNRFVVLSAPLLVMLSGALLLGKQEDYKTFFKKRCVKVLIPWIVWSFLYMIIWFNLHHSQIITEFFAPNISIFLSWTRFFFQVFMSNFWFLPMIFSLYLVTPFIRILVKNTAYFDNLYLIALWFFAASVLPFLSNSPLFPRWEPNIILSPVYYGGYFLLGYMIIKQKILKINNTPILLLIGISPFLVSLLPVKERLIYEFTSGFLLPGTVIASVFLFKFLFIVSKQLEKYINMPIRRIIAAVSGASFGVYIIHTMLTNLFEEQIVSVLRLFHGELLLTPIVFCVVTIIVLLLQKIPVLKNIVP